eukprot:CAMPEP_0177550734 /NCGR_PEP_ID=MMETSP0369-20130122/65744_1 /TAXON_ID=447022 ORGANISM="Scrippsiella hangoei-like, Strain SHHI-4" /NCGR_SAMPLE_ID=MMETSP0369 /ASSEMBLY_ACC=CAM_ASM_000364 /LENGTH=836 /DNA_ID=CAMNT_0019035983 /DNA_START=44 /DNA_END=2550 /DNA_ORIENTATION=-
MTVAVGSPPAGPLAIFGLIGDFLEKCQFRAAAAALRSESPPQLENDTVKAGFARGLRNFVDAAALCLAEVEMRPGALTRGAAVADSKEQALEVLVDGLLRKLMASGHALSDETLNASIDSVLTSDAFANFNLGGGGPLDKPLAGGYGEAFGVGDIDVHKYWEYVQRESRAEAIDEDDGPERLARARRALSDPATTVAAADTLDDDDGPERLARARRALAAAGGSSSPGASAPCAGPSEAPALTTPAGPSSHYRSRRRRDQEANSEEFTEYDQDHAKDDEYHDDDDPGYRIREIYEAELLAELSHKQPPPQHEQRGRVAPGAVADELCEAADGRLQAAVAPIDLAMAAGGSSPGASPMGAGPSEAWSGLDEAVGNSVATSAATGRPPSELEEERSVSPTFGGSPVADVSISADGAGASIMSDAAGRPTQRQGLTTTFTPEQQAADEQRRKEAREAQRNKPRKPAKYAASGDAFYPVELDGAIFDSFNLRIVFERDKTGFEESKELPIKMNTVVAARYQILEYLGSAAFSRAVQCLDLENNKMVCMKIIKNDKDFFDQSLDEIKLLKYININGDVDDNSVLKLYDYFYHKEHLIIVTELLRDNLYEFSKFNRECGDEPYFTLGRLQKITKQVLTALDYVHSLRLIHCDLKPENILIRSYSRCEVKVIDFGSSCFVDDHLSSYVQSRSYRAPEVMLGLPYDQKIDLWSLGCILAELWTGYVLFQNDSVQSLLARIVGIIGDFPYHLMTRGRYVPQYFTQDGTLYQEIDGPACPERGRRLHLLVPKKTSLRQRMRTDCEEFLDFLTQLLHLDPSLRPTAAEAMAASLADDVQVPRRSVSL